MEKRRHVAVPRALVWAALVVFTLYSGLRLAAGPGRDTIFEGVTWTGGAIAEVVILTLVFAGLFARAAWLTYRTEIAAPPAGTVVISGARMGVLADAFLALVGGLFLLLAVYMTLRIPEAILVGNIERYKHYASVSLMPNIMCLVIFGGCGFVLMILRRYVWVFAPGKPPVRYWARAFSRGRQARGLELYWTFWYRKEGAGPVVRRVPEAHWLRARDPSSRGFFRDCDLELATYVGPEEMQRMRGPLEREAQKRGGSPHEVEMALAALTTAPAQLHAIEQAWQQRFAQLTGVMPPVVPEDKKA
jgi:hypothetical protein